MTWRFVFQSIDLWLKASVITFSFGLITLAVVRLLKAAFYWMFTKK